MFKNSYKINLIIIPSYCSNTFFHTFSTKQRLRPFSPSNLQYVVIWYIIRWLRRQCLLNLFILLPPLFPQEVGNPVLNSFHQKNVPNFGTHCFCTGFHINISFTFLHLTYYNPTKEWKHKCFTLNLCLVSCLAAGRRTGEYGGYFHFFWEIILHD